MVITQETMRKVVQKKVSGDEKLKLKKWIEAYRCKYH
jgi:hypothetical protein